MNKNWTIKLPDTVPPAIAKPFLSIIPALVSLYIIAILTFLLNRITGKILTDVIYEILQRPMLGLSQSFCCYISCFLSSIFLVFRYSWWKCYGTYYGRCIWSSAFS